MVRTLKRVRLQGAWERGYLCHVYWVGKRKMGVIKLGAPGEWDHVYRWECMEANLRGASPSLDDAKRHVESVLHVGAYQPDLFASPAEMSASVS